MFNFLDTSEQAVRRERCEAVEAIREYFGREPTEKEIEDYLHTS